MTCCKCLFHVAALLTLLVNTQLYAETAVDKILGLGDSLMDVGNDFVATGNTVPPPTRYAPGRFSNGPVIIEHLAEPLCDSVSPSLVANFATDACISYAWGGSSTGVSSQVPGGGLEVPGLLSQLTSLAQDSGGMIETGTTVVIWTGANDVMFGINSPQHAVANIKLAIENLVALGAEHITVLGLPDLSRVPLIEDLQHRRLHIKLKVLRFNIRLKYTLAVLSHAHPGLRLEFVDTYRPFNIVLSNPKAFNFSTDLSAGPAAGCLFAGVLGVPPDCSPISPQSFNTKMIFWDEVHVNTRIHEIVAAIARGSVF